MNTETKTPTRVNVTPSSTEGHFIVGAKQVVDLDKVNETFLIEGVATLETKNHTSLEIKTPMSLITCQQVFNPFSGMFSKSRD